MFRPNDRPQTSRSNASHGMSDQANYGLHPHRHMGPPSFNAIPQPVEIDPSRQSGPYPPWAGTVYPLGPLEEPNSPFSSGGSPSKSVQLTLDYGTRGALDPMEAWYAGNDGPWLPRGTVPEAAHDDRTHLRGQPNGFRNVGYGPPVGSHHRIGDPSDGGSVHYGVVPPSDSGYGTKRSLENVSVRSYEMTNPGLDGRHLMDRNMEVQPYGDAGSSREPLEMNNWAPAHIGTELSNSTPGRRCEICGNTVKTKSELKKHNLRHTKPFHCLIQDCPRREGYSTANDLDRHMKSKHPTMLPAGRPHKTYRCLVERCKSKDKAWPRLDNFRSHLKRIHKITEDEIELHVRRNDAEYQSRMTIPQESKIEPKAKIPDIGDRLSSLTEEPLTTTPLSEPVPRNSEKSTDCGHADPAIDPTLEGTNVEQALVPPSKAHVVEPTHSRDVGPVERRASWQVQPQGKHGCLDDTVRQTASETSGSTLPPIINETKPSPKPTASEGEDMCKAAKRTKNPIADADLRDAISDLLKAKIGQGGRSPHSPHDGRFAGASDALPTPALVRPIDVNLPSFSMHMATMPNKHTPSHPKEDSSSNLTEELLELIRKAGYTIKKDPKSTGAVAAERAGGSSTAKKTENQVQCNLCPRKGRPCELKKHMRRHERPYGCTFPNCKKAFGSKNDWKRHENSQHYQSEQWRCDEPGCSTKMFHQVALFKSHLAETHQIVEVEAVERKISGQRIGPNFQAHFWCGFCKKVVNLDQKGVDAWTERFNHIDDHFMGRNEGEEAKLIDLWIYADSEDGQGVQMSLKEDIGDESSSSGSRSSGTSPKSETPSGEVVSVEKRRRDTSSDEPEQRPAKQVKYDKMMQCCSCNTSWSERIYPSCFDCGHKWCNQCDRTGRRQQERF